MMIPFIPHLAHECLFKLNCQDINKWPKIDKKAIEDSEIKLVVQINGKTRDVLNMKRNLPEGEVDIVVKKSNKVKKYIENKKISKTIFVKNKIINYIVNN